MTYILMGLDECNQAFRMNDKQYKSKETAQQDLDAMVKNWYYPEGHGFWVEELKDMQYYTDQQLSFDKKLETLEANYWNKEYKQGRI